MKQHKVREEGRAVNWPQRQIYQLKTATLVAKSESSAEGNARSLGCRHGQLPTVPKSLAWGGVECGCRAAGREGRRETTGLFLYEIQG